MQINQVVIATDLTITCSSHYISLITDHFRTALIRLIETSNYPKKHCHAWPPCTSPGNSTKNFPEKCLTVQTTIKALLSL